MKSAVILDTVGSANSVCGCFTAMSTSAPGDGVPSGDNWTALFSGPDWVELREARSHQPSQVIQYEVWSGVATAPATAWNLKMPFRTRVSVSSTCFLYFMPDLPGSPFALLGSRRRQCFSSIPCFTPAPASLKPDALP